MIDLHKEVDIQKSLRDNHKIYVLPLLNIHGWYFDVKYDHKESSELLISYTEYRQHSPKYQYYETYEEALFNGNCFAIKDLEYRNKHQSQYELLLELKNILSSELDNKDKIILCFKKCNILDDNYKFTE